MLLFFSNGEQFASGSTPYDSHPATPTETFERIMLQVEIEGIMTEAYLDTGGIYLVCTPAVAKLANLPAKNLFDSVKPQSINIRGQIIPGDLCRTTLTIPAERGYGITIDATTFVPRINEKVDWEDFPCILGLYGCLERLRFAIDPSNTYFYFGNI